MTYAEHLMQDHPPKQRRKLARANHIEKELARHTVTYWFRDGSCIRFSRNFADD